MKWGTTFLVCTTSLAAAATVLSSGCHSRSAIKAQRVPGEQGVIFVGSPKLKGLVPGHHAATDYWTPSTGLVAFAVQEVRRWLEADSQQSNSARHIAENFGEYKQQYFGVVSSSSQRILVCSFIMADEDILAEHWTRMPLEVLDGDAFRFDFDVESGAVVTVDIEEPP